MSIRIAILACIRKSISKIDTVTNEHQKQQNERKRIMKMKTTLAALAVTFNLVACGGSGGDFAPAPQPGTSAPATARDPYTNKVVSGTLTNTITGVVFNSATVGSTVAAFEVQPNGTNGTLLGLSNITGTDGWFTIQLAKEPTGMVRLVATGGNYISEGDGTRQENGTLELVTPYVTSTFNNFVITPVTHVASSIVRYRASTSGMTLTNAYTMAMGTALGLSGENYPLRGRSDAGVAVLATMPNSPADTLNAYADVIKAFELFGVQYDLPSKTVMRVAARLAELDFPITYVDGSLSQVVVGNWVNGIFDDTVNRTASQIFRSTFDTILSGPLNEQLYENAVCKGIITKETYAIRFPAGASSLDAGRCATVAKNVAALDAKKLTNNRK